MIPRAFLIRTLFPPLDPRHEAETLGLYAAAASRSWKHFPRIARIDGLTRRQISVVRDKARLHGITTQDALPGREDDIIAESLLMFAEPGALTALARDVAREHAEVGSALDRLIASLEPRDFRLVFRSGVLRLGTGAGAALMGILNVTPDSFSDGGRHLEPDAAVDRGLEMARQGAAIIDVGGESSRPGADPVPPGEELRRVVEPIRHLRRELPGGVVLSVDTMKAEVARAAIEAGAEIINDVSGLSADPAMRTVAAETGAHVVIGHMRGTPRDMQDAPAYRHVIPEVIGELCALAAAAVEQGVPEERILLDPGIGFGKRPADNVAIVSHLGAFASLGYPVVLGASRKSFLHLLAPDEGSASSGRSDSTLVAETCAVLGGVHVLRTHDPERAGRAARIAGRISGHLEEEQASG